MRMSMIARRSVVLPALALVAACASPAPQRDAGPPRTAAPFTPAAALALVNAYRAESGAAPVRLDPALARAAESHSRAQQAARRMSHDVGASFTERLAANGIAGRAAVENVAWGQRSLGEVMEGWKRSPGHASNMRDTGVTRMGIAEAGTYWTLIMAGD